MLVGWRIAAPEFAQTPEDMLAGEGARLYGGRWNSPGMAAVYLGDSLALAGMELLVRLMNRDVLRTFKKMPVYIPEDPGLVMHIDASELPSGWETGPRMLTRAIGDAWLQDRQSLVLQVPSAVVAGEMNFIVNPLHENFDALSPGPISDFHFDSRLARP